jgi:hypothetical protein
VVSRVCVPLLVLRLPVCLSLVSLSLLLARNGRANVWRMEMQSTS